MKAFQLLTLCSVLAVAGCGETDTGGRVAVSGNITYEGQPLPEGRIVFTPVKTNAGYAAGGAIEEGRFSIRAEHGPAEGDYQVTVTIGGIPNRTIGVDPAENQKLQPLKQQTYLFSRTIKAEGDNVLDFDLLPQNSDRPAALQ